MIFSTLLRGLRPRALAKTPVFSFPVRKPTRIAVLEAHFRDAPDMREFALVDMHWLRAWQPEALVLPLGLALSLADQKLRGLIDLPSLDTAIVVLTSFDDSPLARHHRDLLWQAFHVPVYEQLRGHEGLVIASECEVHDGLHLRDNESFGLEGEIVIEPCACGLETPRLRSRIPMRMSVAV